MDDYQDHWRDRDQALDERVKVKRPTVRQRIKTYLEIHRGRWIRLVIIQEALHASSTRSRLQELMQDERLRGVQRCYHEREVTKPPSEGGGRWKEYRYSPPTPDLQIEMFHVEHRQEDRP